MNIDGDGSTGGSKVGFEDRRDLRDEAGSRDATLPDEARSVRSERAFGILKDIARTLGIPFAAFFDGTTDGRDLALADLCRAADLIAGAPAAVPPAQTFKVLRREAEVTEPPVSDVPVVKS